MDVSSFLFRQPLRLQIETSKARGRRRQKTALVISYPVSKYNSVVAYNEIMGLQ